MLGQCSVKFDKIVQETLCLNFYLKKILMQSPQDHVLDFSAKEKKTAYCPSLLEVKFTGVSQYPNNFRQTRRVNLFWGHCTLVRPCSYLVEAEINVSSLSGCNQITRMKCKCIGKSRFHKVKTGLAKASRFFWENIHLQFGCFLL